jgi:hypothetical protein
MREMRRVVEKSNEFEDKWRWGRLSEDNCWVAAGSALTFSVTRGRRVTGTLASGSKASTVMKLIHSDTLRSTPREVKELVRDGVYSLYVVEHAEAGFVLVTDRGDLYLLSHAGTIMPAPNGANLESFELREAVSFSDASAYGSACVNVA